MDEGRKATRIITTIIQIVWLLLATYISVLFQREYYRFSLPSAFYVVIYLIIVATGIFILKNSQDTGNTRIYQAYFYMLPVFLNMMRFIWFDQIFRFPASVNGLSGAYLVIFTKSVSITASVLSVITWIIWSFVQRWLRTHVDNGVVGSVLLKIVAVIAVLSITYYVGSIVYHHQKERIDAKNAEYAHSRLTQLTNEKGFETEKLATENLYADIYSAAIISDYLCCTDSSADKDMLKETVIISVPGSIYNRQKEKNKKLYEKYEIPEDGIEFKVFQMKANRNKKTITASVSVNMKEKDTGNAVTGCFYVTVNENWSVIDMGFMDKPLL